MICTPDHVTIKFGKPTNADRIRAMTDEELAETFDLLTRTKPDSKDDKQSWLEWLKQEVKNE